MFTVMDALMLEEYFFNHLFQLYDFAHGMYNTETIVCTHYCLCYSAEVFKWKDSLCSKI